MCQQCQATLRKGHILIFLVCFSVDVPEALGLCCWSERRARGRGVAPRGHPDRDREQCLEPGLARKPLSPVPPGASQGSLLAHTSRVPIHRLQLASSHGDFIVLPSSPPVCNPAFPPHLPVFISLSTYEDLIYTREFFRLAASFSYQFQ